MLLPSSNHKFQYNNLCTYRSDWTAFGGLGEWDLAVLGVLCHSLSLPSYRVFFMRIQNSNIRESKYPMDKRTELLLDLVRKGFCAKVVAAHYLLYADILRRRVGKSNFVGVQEREGRRRQDAKQRKCARSSCNTCDNCVYKMK